MLTDVPRPRSLMPSAHYHTYRQFFNSRIISLPFSPAVNGHYANGYCYLRENPSEAVCYYLKWIFRETIEWVLNVPFVVFASIFAPVEKCTLRENCDESPEINAKRICFFTKAREISGINYTMSCIDCPAISGKICPRFIIGLQSNALRQWRSSGE